MQGQPGLQRKFQDSQGYTEKPCLESKQVSKLKECKILHSRQKVHSSTQRGAKTRSVYCHLFIHVCVQVCTRGGCTWRPEDNLQCHSHGPEDQTRVVAGQTLEQLSHPPVLDRTPLGSKQPQLLWHFSSCYCGLCFVLFFTLRFVIPSVLNAKSEGST